MHGFRLLQTVLSLLLLAGSFAHAGRREAPLVTWTSDPCLPGEAVLLCGENLADTKHIEIVRLTDRDTAEPRGLSARVFEGDTKKARPIQPSTQSVKFVIPESFKPGVFVVRAVTPGGQGETALLNQPEIWWVQGDSGTSARPGGWLRVFGKCLSVPGQQGAILLKGPRTARLRAESDGYNARIKLPGDLPPGDYRIFVHNGCGGSMAWSGAASIRIAPRRQWPQTVFDVINFGANGSDTLDDTSGVESAIAKARANGGGVVYFPRGRYHLNAGLSVPRFTTLRGERRELVSLCWPDVDTPPMALISGTNSFALEDLTLYCSNYVHVIAADQTGADAGNVHLRRLRIRADIYRGHLKPNEVDSRFRAHLRRSSGGGDTIRLGGRNFSVVECDAYGAGRCLFLNRPRGALIADNTFYNGRWGWYCISGANRVIFENNRIIGADLQSTGGGINCLYGNTSSQNVYYAGNRLSLMHGWDREAMTSDAGGGGYFGPVERVEGTKTTLAGDPKPQPDKWRGAGLFILDGRGRGQCRQIVSADGRVVTLDSPWKIAPDSSSVVSLTMLQRHYIFVGNDFSDAGVAIQLYGTAIEHIVARNSSTRTAGYHNFGMQYAGGLQPSWFIQWLDNEVVEGNSYRSGHDNYMLAGEAHLGVYAFPPSVGFDHPLTLGIIVRRNVLRNCARIEIGGGDPYKPSYSRPTVQDVIVENNMVANSDVGIFLRRASRNVLLRGNRFQNVRQELLDEDILVREREKRLRKLLAQKGPIAHWDFESMTHSVVPDASGNRFDAAISGTVAQAEHGVRGKCARFAGQSFLRVEEPTVFNLRNVTLALWLKPAAASGRHGLIGKRYRGAPAPYILSLWDGRLEFEATDEKGQWSFNFRSPVVIAAGRWSHVAAVVEWGRGVTIYVNGSVVARRPNGLGRVFNVEPLIIGREAWAGENNVHNPCYFEGLIDEVKVWARPLSAEEIKAEASASASDGAGGS